MLLWSSPSSFRECVPTTALPALGSGRGGKPGVGVGGGLLPERQAGATIIY